MHLTAVLTIKYLVSDIAIFVLKRDVKLQLTNYKTPTESPTLEFELTGRRAVWSPELDEMSLRQNKFRFSVSRKPSKTEPCY